MKVICPVVGWPTPKVVWHKNGKPVEHPTSKLQFGTAKGSMMTIDDAKESDSGLYICYAINPAGVAMRSSRLKILGKHLLHVSILCFLKEEQIVVLFRMLHNLNEIICSTNNFFAWLFNHRVLMIGIGKGYSNEIR